MCFASLRQGVRSHLCPLGGSGCLKTAAATLGNRNCHQWGWGTAKLTADVLLYPCESDASFFAAFTESQQEGAWGLGTQNGSLPLLTDEAHYVSGATEEQQECMGWREPSHWPETADNLLHLCTLPDTRVSTYPSFQRARMYFFTRSMILSSQTQKEKPLPAMFSWKKRIMGKSRLPPSQLFPS